MQATAEITGRYALVVVGHEVVVMGAAGLGLSGWVVLNHPSDRRKPRCHDYNLMTHNI